MTETSHFREEKQGDTASNVPRGTKLMKIKSEVCPGLPKTVTPCVKQL